jgi:hypothetical protein
MVATDTSRPSRDQRLPDDVVADILGSDRRRYALETLAERDDAMTVDDLAAVVRARERDTSPDAISREERQRVRAEFFQRHLPKLIATDTVRYDSMLGTVELADRESFGDALEEA